MLANTGFATKWMRNEYYSYSHWIPHENEFNNVLCFMLLKFTFEPCWNSIMSCVVRHAANSFIIFASTWILSYILGYWKMDIWKWDIYKSGCFLFRQKWCWCDSDMFGSFSFCRIKLKSFSFFLKYWTKGLTRKFLNNCTKELFKD